MTTARRMRLNTSRAVSPPPQANVTTVGGLEVLRRRDALLREGERLGRFGTWARNAGEERASWSDGLWTIFGLEPREQAPTAAEVFGLIHPDDRERVRRGYEEARARGSSPGPQRYRLVRPDGTMRLVETTTYVVPAAGTDHPAHFVGIVRDVTDESTTREALWQSEETFSAAVRYSAIGMAINARDGRFLRVNPALSQISGYSEAELLALHFHDITHPDDVPEDLALHERLMRGDIPSYELEKRYIHKNGHVIWVRITRAAVRDAAGNPAYAVTQIQDITARRRVRETGAFLREASHVLASSLDSDEVLQILARLALPRLADMCFVDLVVDGGQRRVVATAIDPTKEQTLHIIATRYGMGGWPQDHPVSQASRAGEPLVIESVTDDLLQRSAVDATHLALLRTLRTVSGMVLPLKARSRVIGWLSFYTSESGIRYTQTDAELALDLANAAALAIDNAKLYAEAQRLAQSRDEVLGFVAHDLRAPVASITAWATRLSESASLGEGADGALKAIVASAETMQRLIEDLLDITRIETGTLALAVEPIPPAALLTTTQEQFAATAESKGLRLEVAVDNVPRVNADPLRVQQVLSNLVSNALRFTRSGGSVTLSARSIDHEVVFSVADTGVGVPAQQLGHLFDRLWQSTHARNGGTGLGLAIVKGIVEAHGGRVWVESTAGRGSTFSFTLRRADGGAESAPQETARKLTDVLIAAASGTTRARLVSALAPSAGFAIAGQTGRVEDLVALAAHAPASAVTVIVADADDAKERVPEVVRRLVAREPSARVLVLTTVPHQFRAQDIFRAGATGCAPADVSAERIVAIMRAVGRGETLIDEAEDKPNAPVDPLASLSERERNVLALTAQGYTAAQIGERLFLSPKTVETYRARAMRKLNLSTRAELIALGLRTGLLGTASTTDGGD